MAAVHIPVLDQEQVQEAQVAIQELRGGASGAQEGGHAQDRALEQAEREEKRHSHFYGTQGDEFDPSHDHGQAGHTRLVAAVQAQVSG